MLRFSTLILGVGLALSACAPTPASNPSTTSADGKATQSIYRIGRGDVGRLQFRMLDSVNALRSASGAPDLQLNAQLNAAAATHARDMSIQNRPWHFGSDGSSPIDRVQRVGYTGMLVGENIAETFETELETLAAWMEQPDTRRTILSPSAGDLGFSWFQEPNGKIWWVMVVGDPSSNAVIPQSNPSASRLVPEERPETASDIQEQDGVVSVTNLPG